MLDDKELEGWLRSLNSQTLFTNGASKGNPGVTGGVGFSSLQKAKLKLLSLGGSTQKQTTLLKP